MCRAWENHCGVTQDNIQRSEEFLNLEILVLIIFINRRFNWNHQSSSVKFITWRFTIMWQASINRDKGPVPSVKKREPEAPLSIQGWVLHPVFLDIQSIGFRHTGFLSYMI